MTKPLIIDVREDSEFSLGHVDGAVNIPFSTMQPHELPATLGNIEKDQPIIIYCASGGRAEGAAQFLRNFGFKDVTNSINQQNVEKLLSR